MIRPILFSRASTSAERNPEIISLRSLQNIPLEKTDKRLKKETALRSVEIPLYTLGKGKFSQRKTYSKNFGILVFTFLRPFFNQSNMRQTFSEIFVIITKTVKLNCKLKFHRKIQLPESFFPNKVAVLLDSLMFFDVSWKLNIYLGLFTYLIEHSPAPSSCLRFSNKVIF